MTGPAMAHPPHPQRPLCQQPAGHRIGVRAERLLLCARTSLDMRHRPALCASERPFLMRTLESLGGHSQDVLSQNQGAFSVRAA